MKHLKSKLALLLIVLSITTSCGKGDDSNSEINLISLGVCGEFFDGLNLQSLCGVDEFNRLANGPDSRCTYFISPNTTSDQTETLYQVSLVEADSESQGILFINGFKEEYFLGEMLDPLNLGDEAFYGIESPGEESETYILFVRLKNVVVVLFTDRFFIDDVGCSNPQSELIKLANIILNNL